MFEMTYDVSPDGKRFVMSVATEDQNLSLTLMFNWTARMQSK
jgi:hypothetical protein